MDLVSKKCVPCEGGTPPMGSDAVKIYLAQLKDWVSLKDKKIIKEYALDSFRSAMAFANKVAELAEAEGHHPDIFILYNKVGIELSTHAIQGLSENDFIMAAKIDKLPLPKMVEARPKGAPKKEVKL